MVRSRSGATAVVVVVVVAGAAETTAWTSRPGRLLLAHGRERPDAPGAEQLHDADLAELPPVGRRREP